VRLFLIGYKNCGKTTLGGKLARRLSMEFIDLDEFIEYREQKSVPELYNQFGNEGFRVVEWKALKEIVKKDNVVISTGGGAPCHCDNMNLMEKYGEVIYIRLDSEMLVSRLKTATKDRPIVLNKTDEDLRNYIQDLRSRCEHHYTRAKYIVDGKDITVDKVLDVLKLSEENQL
jgi:shikimate kinase